MPTWTDESQELTFRDPILDILFGSNVNYGPQPRDTSSRRGRENVSPGRRPRRSLSPGRRKKKSPAKKRPRSPTKKEVKRLKTMR